MPRAKPAPPRENASPLDALLKALAADAEAAPATRAWAERLLCGEQHEISDKVMNENCTNATT